MLYREIIAVCSQVHTKHTSTLCGQNVELLNVKLVVQIVTIWHERVVTIYIHVYIHTLICIYTHIYAHVREG